MSTELLEVSLVGVGTVLRLERDAWSMVKRLRQATNEYAPPHPLSSLTPSRRWEGVVRILFASSRYFYRDWHTTG